MSNNGWIDQKYVVHIYNGIITQPLKRIMPSAATCMDLEIIILSTSAQFSSIAQSCSTLCDPVDCSMTGLPVHHQLPEFTQTHVHWVSDAINHLILCRPLLLLPSIFPSIRFFPMSQFFISGDQSIGASASVLPRNIQNWFPSGLTGLISSQSKGLSRVFSNTTL